MQLRWRMDGFAGPPRPTGAPRNLLGFKDGIANPAVHDAAEMNKLIWVQPARASRPGPPAARYHVVRVIRMLVEFWDRVTISEQERMIGRRRDSGAPLSGQHRDRTPGLRQRPAGRDDPARRAHPAGESRAPRRRTSAGSCGAATTTTAGIDSNGNLDMGLIFTCFQQDLDRQFVAVQKRLADEPLVDYISPVGGGYFFALPGVTDVQDWYGRALLTS